MELVRNVLRAMGPVILGACLLALPLLFAPERARAADSGICAGYDTVECGSSEWCVGVKWFGFGYCQTKTTYWPPVTVIVQEALQDYFSGGGLVGGGGGAF